MKDIQHRESSAIRKMFDGIAPTYDLLNRLISFGLDRNWRKRAVIIFKEKINGDFLDIAAGSGDVSLELLRLHPQSVVATDFSMKMLLECKKKIEQRENNNIIQCAAVDAHKLPFQTGIFDGTIVAFGIRNFEDRLLSLKEMYRVLKSGGISVILELTHPRSPIISALYSFHAKFLLPVIGRIISRHNSAYSYLPRSIEAFPDENEFLELMREAGYVELKARRLTFGAATIFVGKKITEE
ncbi:MAG: bifunctional demethylmenaquinone methyltransferase/2-methoxy-6-polyprenyl-1,4-benzoquinol methylase UbiE [Ignavibacteriales bacterium]|nr:bifunctional demethylmenaquinone methyltransferase/2-methoxy-6-polyprenyl-1,4-benzoquinol methylase UbiE [Ignavibacteriales bacterium]